MQIESTGNCEEENIDDIQQICSESCPADTTSSVTSLVNKSSVEKCEGCGELVGGSSFLLVENMIWHIACLKCCACAQMLSEQTTCFVRDGNIYCKEDYQELFISQSCASCGVFIKPHELVMHVRDGVYHANETCFSCCLCKRHLVRGEKFFEDARNLFCWNCCQTNFYLEKEANEVPGNKPGRPRKRKQAVTSSQNVSHLSINLIYDDGQLQSCNSHQNSITQPTNTRNQRTAAHCQNQELHSATERSSYQNKKTKRVRTSFKHHQLCAMKAYFDLNHNPDAKDLKQLAQETGLTKRVLQVWFQNARAKFRRSCLRNETKVGCQVKQDEHKTETCLNLSCSDSVSSAFEESPIFDEPNTLSSGEQEVELMTSYSEHSSNQMKDTVGL